MSTAWGFRTESDLLAQLDPARPPIQRQLAGNAGQFFAQSCYLAFQALRPGGAVRQDGLGLVQQIDGASLFGDLLFESGIQVVCPLDLFGEFLFEVVNLRLGVLLRAGEFLFEWSICA